MKTALQFIIPLAGIAAWGDARQSSRLLTQAVAARKPSYDTILADRMVEKLNSSGYQASVLQGARGAEGTDAVDYMKLKFDADVAVELTINAMGFYSGYGSQDFRPQINVNALAFTSGGKSYPYEGNVYFGVDAQSGKDWAILAPEATKWESFEKLLDDITSVDALFRDALVQIADRLVAQIVVSMPVAKPTQ